MNRRVARCMEIRSPLLGDESDHSSHRGGKGTRSELDHLINDDKEDFAGIKSEGTENTNSEVHIGGCDCEDVCNRDPTLSFVFTCFQV